MLKCRWVKTQTIICVCMFHHTYLSKHSAVTSAATPFAHLTISYVQSTPLGVHVLQFRVKNHNSALGIFRVIFLILVLLVRDLTPHFKQFSPQVHFLNIFSYLNTYNTVFVYSHLLLTPILSGDTSDYRNLFFSLNLTHN